MLSTLKNWLGFPRSGAEAARSSRPTAALRRARLGVEALEDRLVPAVIPHVEVVPIFLGSAWQTQANLAFGVALKTALLVRSDYMSILGRAGYGVGTGT